MSNKYTKPLIIGAFLTALLGSSAYAAPPTALKMDTNADGMVDNIEFVTAANARFAAADTNGDGQVTQDERRAAKAAKAAEKADERFDKADANGDGFVSKAEMQARRADVMAQKAERQENWQEKRAERKANRAQDGNSGNKAQRDKLKRIKPDANNDGVVDYAEHSAATDQAFARLDKNGNGVLEAGELKAMKHMAFRKKHGKKNSRGGGR